jgi:isocitrate dehydrogenase
VKWEPVDVTPQLKDGKTSILPETVESIKRNKVALKGPLAVSISLHLVYRVTDMFRLQLVKAMCR